MNRRANQLAHHLRHCGVGPESRVGLSLERSAEAMIALLGVLKAGAAYVPLDPTYPQERIATIVEDAAPVVLLTQQGLVAALPTEFASVICLDTDWPALAQENDDNPESETSDENVAYVIYTSGSTGKPKGVQLSFGALENLIRWQLTHAKLPEARTLQFTTLNFDVSFQEIFATWCSGGTLVMVAEAVRRDAMQLWGYVAERAVERLFLPAVALQQLAEVAESVEVAVASLREVITAGEQLRVTPPLVRLFDRLPACRLENQYGPTESHVVTAYALTGEPAQWPGLPPIGRPLDNTQIYLLDSRLQPVPIGVTGELYVGGDNLARGYLYRPDLTAERFIPDDFAASEGRRLYKTGDLARWRADGDIEFLGRNDSQVKIRGYRVEPGETEAALLEHEGVRDAVVMAIGDGSDRRLAAYVVCHSDQAPSVGELREFVKNKLPEYMWPSVFTRMEALPLTPSGKVNRRALPPPDLVNPLGEDGYVAPRTATEAGLAEIWQAVLKLPTVGVNDNFFALGGHSLLATQVMSRLRAAFDVELPVRHLFESPTVAELAAIVEEQRVGKSRPAQADGNEREKAMADDTARKQALLAERQALLARLAELEATLQSEDETDEGRPIAPGVAATTEAAAASPAQFIPRRPDRSRAPLSFAQQRLWFIHQLDPQSSAYNMPTAIRLCGDLQVAALDRSLNEIIRRHDALRTTFEVIDNLPVQVIAPSLVLKLAVERLDHLPESEREAAASRRVEEEARRPFDLAHGPLFRASLLKLSPQDHVLLATLPHIVSDGWSIGVLVAELTALYEAYSQGKPSPLEPLPIQYADFAAWQRQWLSGDVLDAQLSYWKEQLAGVPTLINLPADRPRPVRQSFRGAEVQLLIVRPTAEALNQLSQSQGVTLFMTLLAAYQTLLARYTRQEDIVVGIPIANRNRKELEGLIGFFVNSLVMRTDLSGAPTFIELLARVREVALGAYAYQDLPFEMILEAMQLERTLSHNPLFQAVFTMLNTPNESLELPGLSIGPFRGEVETEKFDLTLRVMEEEAGLQISLGYNTDIFDAARIQRMAGHFKNLLESIVAHPESRLGALPLLDEAERQQVLYTWNPTTSFTLTHTLHELFQLQAASRPDAIALSCRDSQLSYGELNQRANQLAGFLRRRGVGPEQVVALLLERTPQALISMLAVLKTGGAYLPL
ncbi:MAG TPA: amino acid adenylation domain-containing protein, partial [Blastocatellia bacterium]|nr:amino acid adenylation domain-containing protein [Blastocatellia bacterium]